MNAYELGFQPFHFNPVTQDWEQQDAVVVGHLEANMTLYLSGSLLRADDLARDMLYLDENLLFSRVKFNYSPDGTNLLNSEYTQVGGRFKLFVLHTN